MGRRVVATAASLVLRFKDLKELVLRTLFPYLFAAMAFASIARTAAPADRAAGRLRFSGRTWTVVDHEELRGPGPNVFDGRNVGVDAEGRLILETAFRDGRWTSAHVFLTKSLGYGTYELTLSPMEKSLDLNAVFGFFTWDEDPAYANREIDIEFARWGVPQAPNLSFTVQPWEGHPERSAGYEFSAGERTILRFVWEPDRIAFSAESSGKSVSWSFPADEGSTSAPFTVPPVGRERVGINLWLFQGRAPAAPDRVVVERFAFTPMPKR